MGNLVISDTYRTTLRDRPVSAIRIRAAAGNPRRGWLIAEHLVIPVALGRGGIKADKREGDGATPRGLFHPLRLWWRADRHSRPRPRIAGRGSAVFLHLARPGYGPTAGCVSMKRPAMLQLLARIGPGTKIVIG